jgi:glutamine synthetase
MLTYDSVKELIVMEEIEFIDFKIVDMIGRWRHITVPVSRFLPNLLEDGVAFDGSNFGYASVEGSDMLLYPDLDTAVIDYYNNEKVLSIISDIYLAGGRGPFTGDPRGVLKRAQKYLVSEGIAQTAMMSPEFEFYVFAQSDYSTGDTESHYTLTPLNSNTEYSFYHISPPEDQLFSLRNEICRQLEKRGIPVKYHHHEVGPLGQLEIELGFGEALKMADTTLAVKNLVRNISAERGLSATFLPKPVFGQNGNGMHVHQYLASQDKSIFEQDGALSELGLCYVGGILSHGRSLFGLTNPSTNSYCRLVPGYEAPVSLAFGEGNRSAAIRIPGYATPAQRRVELRTVDAMCNPYFAFAGMLMAGIDGITRKLNATKLGFGPYSQDLYDVSSQQLKEIKQAPASLGEALDALEKDHDYLIIGDVFDEHQIQQWIQAKREEEQQLRRRPHPYEFSVYYGL